jgi:hypothetical protein
MAHVERCTGMISWKRSLWTLNEEYEVARKKKQALDNLLSTGRISQSTHDMFDMEIAEAIDEIENRQKTLLQKMNVKIAQLGDQVKTLEILLADFEIEHITGEIDEETYQREINVLSMGLETSRLELNSIKEAADQLASGGIFVKQADEQQATEIGMEQEKPQKPTVELQANETDGTPSAEAEVRGIEAAQSAERPAETKENQGSS